MRDRGERHLARRRRRQGTYNAAFSAQVLSILIQDKVVRQDVVRLRLPEPPSLSSIALAQLETALTPPPSGCPGSAPRSSPPSPRPTAQLLVKFQVDEDALAAHLAGTSLTDRGLARYAPRHRTAMTLACVSVIEVATKATAVALRSRILRGASFAALAKANSIDTDDRRPRAAPSAASPTRSSRAPLNSDRRGA